MNIDAYKVAILYGIIREEWMFPYVVVDREVWVVVMDDEGTMDYGIVMIMSRSSLVPRPAVSLAGRKPRKKTNHSRQQQLE